jgi:hypothetical protein
MKTKVNMSKAALLIELGWEPINDFWIDREPHIFLI